MKQDLTPLPRAAAAVLARPLSQVRRKRQAWLGRPAQTRRERMRLTKTQD